MGKVGKETTISIYGWQVTCDNCNKVLSNGGMKYVGKYCSNCGKQIIDKYKEERMKVSREEAYEEYNRAIHNFAQKIGVEIEPYTQKLQQYLTQPQPTSQANVINEIKEVINLFSNITLYTTVDEQDYYIYWLIMPGAKYIIDRVLWNRLNKLKSLGQIIDKDEEEENESN